MVKRIADIEEIKDMAMTSNGSHLKKFARILKDNGLSGFNISLDTMREDRFFEVTRGGGLKYVQDGRTWWRKKSLSQHLR